MEHPGILHEKELGQLQLPLRLGNVLLSFWQGWDSIPSLQLSCRALLTKDQGILEIKCEVLMLFLESPHHPSTISLR